MRCGGAPGIIWFGLVGNGGWGRVVLGAQRAQPACSPQPPSLSSTFPLGSDQLLTSQHLSAAKSEATLGGMSSKP